VYFDLSQKAEKGIDMCIFFYTVRDAISDIGFYLFNSDLIDLRWILLGLLVVKEWH
jgi:hypothetical protein